MCKSTKIYDIKAHISVKFNLTEIRILRPTTFHLRTHSELTTRMLMATPARWRHRQRLDDMLRARITASPKQLLTN